MMKSKHDIWVAFPDSLLSEAPSLREKTVKVGTVARICSIFGISRIYIYDLERSMFDKEGRLLQTLLEYIETPQYLRKRIYREDNDLQFTGMMPPLRTPHHKLMIEPSELKEGDIREAVVVKSGGGFYVDAGLSNLIPLESPGKENTRVTVKFKSVHQRMLCEIISRKDIDEYWGYQVKIAPTLGRLIKSLKCNTVILTSVKGISIEKSWKEISERLKESDKTLIVFGSASKGIFEILSEEDINPNHVSDFIVNTVPDQNVSTVRTEEALNITLGILNILSHI